MSFTVSGLDANVGSNHTTAVVTFTSSGGGTPVTANVLADGSGTVNLSTLPDGTITATIQATDTAGNTASGASDTSIKDVAVDTGSTA